MDDLLRNLVQQAAALGAMATISVTISPRGYHDDETAPEFPEVEADVDVAVRLEPENRAAGDPENKWPLDGKASPTVYPADTDELTGKALPKFALMEEVEVDVTSRGRLLGHICALTHYSDPKREPSYCVRVFGFGDWTDYRDYWRDEGEIRGTIV